MDIVFSPSKQVPTNSVTKVKRKKKKNKKRFKCNIFKKEKLMSKFQDENISQF